MITIAQLRELEEQAIEQGITIEELMEKAGKQVFLAVKKRVDLDQMHVLVFCGSGNNGGDGFVAARYFAKVCPAVVLLFGDKEKFSIATQKNYDKIKKKINVLPINQRKELASFHVQPNHGLVLVDALLGIGSKGTLRDPISFAVDYFNSLEGFKVAIDIPSGLNPDTGEIKEKMCDVDLIVTFHDLKPGLEQFQEKVVVVDIGLPRD